MKLYLTKWGRNIAGLTLVVATSTGYAHTLFRNQFYVAENTTDYDFAQTGHGCFPNGPNDTNTRTPILGSSVVFPTDKDAIVQYFPASLNVGGGWGNPQDPATAGLNSQVKKGDLPSNFGWTFHTGAAMDLNSVGDVLSTMPNTDVFLKWKKKYIGAANGNGGATPVGFATYGGPAVDAYSTLAYPVRLNGIKFKPTSCAQSLTIRVAIADWCSTKWPVGNGSANLWINHTTPKFNNADVDGIAPGGTPASFWPSIKVVRNLTTNPLPTSCNGAGLDYFVTPSDAQIDRDLIVPGVWGK